MSHGCSGQLFAFSGLDGPTQSTTNFVGIFQNASNYDMRFCLKSDRYVRIRVPTHLGPGDVLASTNDVVWAEHSGGSSSSSAVTSVKLAWQSWDVLMGTVPSGSTVSMDGSVPVTPPSMAPAGMTCESCTTGGARGVSGSADCTKLDGTWARPGRARDEYVVIMQGASAFTATSGHPASWKRANGTITDAAAVAITFDNGKHNTGSCTADASGATYLHWSDGSSWVRGGSGPSPSGAPSLVLCQTAAAPGSSGGRNGAAGSLSLALSLADSMDEALAAAAAAAAGAAASVDGTVASRLAWVSRTPVVSTARRQLLLNKAVSVMRVNSLSPEGDITQHWSTPDRQPHKFMWLWDSCYHSMARSVLNDTLGWEFVQSMLSVQTASGAVPIERSPLGGAPLGTDAAKAKGVDGEGMVAAAAAAGAGAGAGVRAGIDTTQTQPPLLAWAIWENYELALLPGGAGKAAALARLQYAVPRLERYLQWDFDNRADPSGETPLLYWLKGTESGMDNSQRFDGYSVRKPLLAVDFSVFAARESAFLARMHGELGNATAASHWAAIAANMSRAVHDTLWDPDADADADSSGGTSTSTGGGFYRDRHTGADGGAFSTVSAVSGLLPLWLPDVPADRAARLVATLSDPTMFAAPVPLPSVALSTAEFSTDMWRGPMWLNTNWHVALALLSRNETQAAQALIGATIDAVDTYYHAHGVVFEFYDSKNATDPTTLKRKGLTSGGVRDYHWTAALTFRMILKLEELESEAGKRQRQQ
eukprot:g1858.t1